MCRWSSHNATGSTLCFGSVVLPPDVLLVHPGPSADSIVRWRAAVGGTYVFAGGFFELLDVAASGVNVSVFKNGTAILGPTALSSPKASCPNPGGRVNIPTQTLVLSQGDVISFGVNNAGNYLNDSTGFDITITKVPDTGGTWTPLANQPTFHPGASLLLTDGTVLVHEESDLPSDGANYGNWYRLTPDIYGSYINGSWSTVPSTLPSGYGPIFFASAVLPDGRAIVEGGEYNNLVQNLTKLGAIFENDPKNAKFNTWTSVAPPAGWSNIGDAQSAVLPDGTYMLASCCSTAEAETSDGGLTWVPTGTFKHDWNDEEGWTLLPGPPDAEVLMTVDAYVNGPGCGNAGKGSEMYINGYWFCMPDTPTQLWDSCGPRDGPRGVAAKRHDVPSRSYSSLRLL